MFYSQSSVILVLLIISMSFYFYINIFHVNQGSSPEGKTPIEIVSFLLLPLLSLWQTIEPYGKRRQSEMLP